LLGAKEGCDVEERQFSSVLGAAGSVMVDHGERAVAGMVKCANEGVHDDEMASDRSFWGHVVAVVRGWRGMRLGRGQR
jgi:hypothetical protein